MRTHLTDTTPERIWEALDHATASPVSTQTDIAPWAPVEAIEENVDVIDESSPVTRFARAVGAATEWLFGLFSLVLALSLLATLPLIQLLSLGFLLDVSGRVAQSGRLRDGFVGIPKAARVGSLVFGTWLFMLPLRLVSDYWYSSHLIDPGSNMTRGWRIGLFVLTTLTVMHILSAWYCGGRLRHFFWPLLAPFTLATWLMRTVMARSVTPAVPHRRRSLLQRTLTDLICVAPLRQWFLPAIVWNGLRRGGIYGHCRDSVWDFVVSLRLPHYFWVGLRGFCGAFAWLVLPVSIFAAASVLPPGPAVLAGLAGALLLMLVVLYLPFLQAHFAAENRWSAIFELGHVRHVFRRAPLAFLCALFVTLVFALPLYLLMVEQTPREVTFLPALVFVTFAYPARLLSGWALGRAQQRELPRHFVFRWTARLCAVPVVGFYVFIVFFTRYTSWYGVWSLYEQHAFLMPVPFLGL